jgi:hypothetical protein
LLNGFGVVYNSRAAAWINEMLEHDNPWNPEQYEENPGKNPYLERLKPASFAKGIISQYVKLIVLAVIVAPFFFLADYFKSPVPIVLICGVLACGWVWGVIKLDRDLRDRKNARLNGGINV